MAAFVSLPPPKSPSCPAVDASPDFVIAGVARAGTTSLWMWLNQHPELHLSAVKETNFFSRPDLRALGPGDEPLEAPFELEDDGSIRLAHVARVDSWDSYRHCLTPQKPGVVRRGEASVSYSFYPQALARLRAANPDCRIVLVLRHPVARVISNYLLFCKLEMEWLDLRTAIEEEASRLKQGFQFCWAYSQLSRYRSMLANIRAHFPLEQIFLARFEDLVEGGDPLAWEDLLRFLGVNPSFEPQRVQINDTKDMDFEVDPELLTDLHRMLASEIEFYEALFASPKSRRRVLGDGR